jgi:Zn-dependent alcohol dehydrogenase
MERPEKVKRVLAAIQKDGLTQTLSRVFDKLDTPVALGYSCAGTVVDVAQDAGTFAIGDRVGLCRAELCLSCRNGLRAETPLREDPRCRRFPKMRRVSRSARSHSRASARRSRGSGTGSPSSASDFSASSPCNY